MWGERERRGMCEMNECMFEGLVFFKTLFFLFCVCLYRAHRAVAVLFVMARWRHATRVE